MAAIDLRLAVLISVINWGGAALTFVYLGVVFPSEQSVFEGKTLSLGAFAAIAAVYCTIGMTIGIKRGWRALSRVRAWAASDRPPTAEEREDVLRFPLRSTVTTAVLWAVAAPIFGVLVAVDVSMQSALETETTIFLAGMTTSAAVYLASERIARPALAMVLGSEAPPEAGSLGIGPRILLTWLLCSGVPLLILAMLPMGSLPDDARDLVAPIWFVVAVALVGGLVAMKVASQAVARPVRAVRRAMDAVAAGDVTASVPVDDGSEVGRLQAGFNAMVEGLRERERLQDLFGRHVGTEVARETMERGVDLRGRACTVSALFVDVTGSTTLASERPPQEVVALLNRFFGVVVSTVERHGGWVNKFEGDAALCIFGAPTDQHDQADRALAAARELRERLDALRGQTGLDAAIGVAHGTAVAGHVGAESRLEYTIIGDPVNEAARLVELAKGRSVRLLASGAAVEAAGPAEARRWETDGEIVLRGRRRPTTLAAPRTQDAVSAPNDSVRSAR